MKLTPVIFISALALITLSCGNGQTEQNIQVPQDSDPEFRSLAPTPPMGWNSWNYFKKNAINEVLIRECMDALVSEGLLSAGYEYFVIDGGWRDTKLGEQGELLPHPEKFPGGIKALSDHAHSLGLKFGLHTVPGTHDCGRDLVGGFGIEEVHIQQFIDWGLDFIKVDKCILNLEGQACEDCWTEEVVEETYRKWRQILDDNNSDMLLSISAYKFRDWNPEVCNMSRTTYDIGIGTDVAFDDSGRKNFFSVMEIAEINNQYADIAGKGYWNDPDMLVNGLGLSKNEEEAHFALWCIMSSPLFLGNDPRNMSSEEKNILTNTDAIAINQDPGEQGRRISKDGKAEIWLKRLSGGDLAVLMLNRSTEEVLEITADWEALGIKGSFEVKDVYEGIELGKYKKSLSLPVEPHGCRFLLIR